MNRKRKVLRLLGYIITLILLAIMIIFPYNSRTSKEVVFSTTKQSTATCRINETTTTEAISSLIEETTVEATVETEAPSEITTTIYQTTSPTTTKIYYSNNIQLDDNQKEILSYVEEICKKYPIVRPAMVMAIIQKESGFNRYADNGKCKGLMQIYEYYNKDRMIKLGVSNLFDAYSNILVGVDLLDGLYTKYGNWSDAIYQYSGGSSSYYHNLLPVIDKYENILNAI